VTRAAGTLGKALARERAGEWELADELFAHAFDLAVESGDLETLADAARGQARLYCTGEGLERAEELALLSRELAERAGLARAAARAMNVQAVVRYRLQDWTGAAALYREALERGLDVGDDELIGSTCLNLGVVSNILGELREARVRYLEGVGSVVRSGNKVTEAMLYNNLGMVCADLEEWLESDLYFARGIEIAERLRLTPLLAQLRVNRAEPLIRLGDLAGARATLQLGEALAVRTGNAAGRADAARFHGLIARAEGDRERAERCFEESLEIARRAGKRLEQAEALRELAELARDAELLPRAQDLARRSLALFQALDARRDVRRLEDLLRDTAAPAPANEVLA
jgi:tetratricopeptide (TPR) repeat protein